MIDRDQAISLEELVDAGFPNPYARVLHGLGDYERARAAVMNLIGTRLSKPSPQEVVDEYNRLAYIFEPGGVVRRKAARDLISMFEDPPGYELPNEQFRIVRNDR